LTYLKNYIIKTLKQGVFFKKSRYQYYYLFIFLFITLINFYFQICHFVLLDLLKFKKLKNHLTIHMSNFFYIYLLKNYKNKNKQ